MIEALINTMKYGNNTRFQSVAKSSYREMYDLLVAYGPQPSFDDMLWYGLSYLRYYEEYGDDKFLSMSE